MKNCLLSCPYCGKGNNVDVVLDTGLYELGFRIECDRCKKEFGVLLQVDITLSVEE